MIGVIPNGSKTMTLHPSSSFCITPKIKGIDKDVLAIDQTSSSYMEKRNALINTFGAGKKKRELASLLAGRVQDDRMVDLSDIKEHISGKAETLGMATDGGAMAAAEEAKMRELLPAFDLTATLPALIYNKKSIVPDHLLAGIEGSWYAAMISDSRKFQKQKSEIPFKCCREMVETLGNCPSSNSNDHRRQGKAVMVLHWFVELYRFSFCKPKVDENGRRQASGNRGISNVDFMLRAFDKQYGPPKEIAQYWLDIFQEKGNSMMINRKKLLAYFSVWMVLLAPKNRVDLQSVLEDLEDPQDKYMSRLAEYIGCEKRANGSWVLRAPLQVPEIREKKRRRK